jgi:hypothetical protein
MIIGNLALTGFPLPLVTIQRCHHRKRLLATAICFHPLVSPPSHLFYSWRSGLMTFNGKTAPMPIGTHPRKPQRDAVPLMFWRQALWWLVLFSHLTSSAAKRRVLGFRHLPRSGK